MPNGGEPENETWHAQGSAFSISDSLASYPRPTVRYSATVKSNPGSPRLVVRRHAGRPPNLQYHIDQSAGWSKLANKLLESGESIHGKHRRLQIFATELGASFWRCNAISFCFARRTSASVELVASGLNQPMTVTSAPGDPRLFVTEKSGVVYTVDRETGAKSLFLDISSKVGTDGERGLLGFTLDPAFQSNGRFYLDYSDRTTGNTIIERYQASSINPSVGDPGSAYRLMTIDQPVGETSHKAGWIGFRPGEPNNLYIASGDGAWRPTTPDPYGNAQNLNSDLGKILRIDVTTTSPGKNYGIPAGNAFAGSGNPEIWAYGVRNPFRDSFDKLTGALWIADVGFSTLDEVNVLAANVHAGTNLGWPVREGNQGGLLAGATDPIFITPVGGGSAIIGGVVYRGPIQSLYGLYFYADYVNKTIKSFRYDPSTGLVSDEFDWTQLWFSLFGNVGFSSFGEDDLGNLFLTDLDGGRLFALTAEIATPLPATLPLFATGLGLLGFVAHRRKPKALAA
jgi:glucose/arabinose dehydrogenase